MKKIMLFLVCLIGFAVQTKAYVVKTTELWCQRGNNKIYGQLIRPDGVTGKMPLVIISHGYNGTHQFGLPYAQVLAEKGIMCYCFDFCGGSNFSRSDGKTTDMSIFTERADLEAIIDYFKTRDDVDSKRITLFGESQGGMVTAITASDRIADVANIILFYPALSIIDDAKARYASIDLVPAQHDFWGMMLGKAFYEDIYDFDVYAEIAKFRKPVLLLHGDLDNVVNISYSERASKTYNDAEYHVLNGAGHGFSGNYQTQALQMAQDFLLKQNGMVDNSLVSDQVLRQKEVENGGNGIYKAVVVSEKTLTSCTVYRPRNVKYAAQREGRLPILIWCNGGCSDTSIDYEKMLTQIASQGYLVIALGAFKMTADERAIGGASELLVGDAINWIVNQEKLASSDYYHAVDVNNIALSGTSCGGAQALANCRNTRVKTLLIMNAGMGTMAMGGASPATLQYLHCPLIYMTGGTGDVAYANATVDYSNITKVPVVWADLPTAGHGGTFWQPAGGDFCRMALRWMDWHMKGYNQYAEIFIKPNLTDFPTWTMKSKNFPKTDYMEAYQPLTTVADTVFNAAEISEDFALGADVSMLTWTEKRGYTFYNRNEKKKTLMVILKEQGMNAVRLRVNVNPTDGTCDANYAMSLCAKAKQQALDVMIDLQFSDSWTGSGAQIKPLAWMGHNIEQLEQDVYDHTTTVLKKLANTGAKLKWLQIGNSVENGILWNEGKAPESMENFIRLFNKAQQAAKEIVPDIQTVVHLSTGNDSQTSKVFLDCMKSAGGSWDVIGLTAVPLWAGMVPDKLAEAVGENVKALADSYKCPVMVTETAHYIDKPVETNIFLCQLIQKVREAGGSGVFYLEPELSEDYRLGAWNLLTRQPSIALDAFAGLQHTEVPYVMTSEWEMTNDTIIDINQPVCIPVEVSHIRPERVKQVELINNRHTVAAVANTQPSDTNPQTFLLEWTDAEHGIFPLHALATGTDEAEASTDTVNVIIGPAAIIDESTIEQPENENKSYQHWLVCFNETGNYMLGFKYTAEARVSCPVNKDSVQQEILSFPAAASETYATCNISIDEAGGYDINICPLTDRYTLPDVSRLVVIPLEGQALPYNADPTAIESIKTTGKISANSNIYDITGRKISSASRKNLPKGIYIIKNKKILIK